LTGDIGTGKTTLCRTLLEQFDSTTFTTLILNPFLSIEELLREVLLSFGVVSKESMRTGRLATASKHELVHTLHDFLLSLVPLHGSAVLLIDEAQHLTPEVLEEIRVISNLETNEQKLLQIVLVGQLNLLDLLQQANLRQLRQRISIRCSLKALTREETDAYITHRLWVARGSTSVAFTPRALELVHALSDGVPRMINLICDKALMAASTAEAAAIDDTHVGSAAALLGLDVPVALVRRAHAFERLRSPRILVAATAVLILAVLGGTLLAVGNPFERLDDKRLPFVRPAPTPRLYPALAPRPAPNATAGIRPPLELGAFSLNAGTFDSARALADVEPLLRDGNFPVYTVDITFGPDDVRRRLLVGRYRTREEAEAALQKVVPVAPGAFVILGAEERLRRPNPS
jgi:type II secretory pathway predicted ATPase ExeA